MEKHKNIGYSKVQPNVLPTQVPLAACLTFGSTPQAVALGIVDEYRRNNQNVLIEDFKKHLLYHVGVYNPKCHPTRRGYAVEFVYEGMHIQTTVQFQCTWQVHTNRRFPPRPKNF